MIFAGQIIGQIIQLSPAADRHQYTRCALLYGSFDDRDGIENRFDGTAQVQTAGYSKAALYTLLEER